MFLEIPNHPIDRVENRKWWKPDLSVVSDCPVPSWRNEEQDADQARKRTAK
jgi:hypothetical protein